MKTSTRIVKYEPQVIKSSTDKTPGKDNISVELIKYASEEVHQEVSKILT